MSYICHTFSRWVNNNLQSACIEWQLNYGELAVECTAGLGSGIQIVSETLFSKNIVSNNNNDRVTVLTE